ncbi:TonB-dependent receptor domain-containing protein [Salinivibrio kushneri]|uniref:TonB-dependent receptor domain-containing protein n=2 Tax=Salinivibrio TaxID=51366 RepID=UPI00098443A3|nr:TonB-dependent receptor [Salinivibrio kushneri]OOE52244.1 hypothetical protein BZG11_04905 [Salinivibrio kushneri]OOE55554.1 hypothetical protein BZG10_02305 [Salinivibrio kushneri]OOE58760.1 hypothetical protein BZG18_14255 [Salinivibrio kushneri]
MTLLLPVPARLGLLTLSIASALCAPAVAADNLEDESIETVSVWGTQVSSSSRYLGETDLTVKQPDHLSDLLRDIPGVDVGGTHSLTQRINIRGFTEQDLDITVDGASQGGKMFHHISNLTLNPDILQRVDVAVGASSILTSELGGAVAFETKDPYDLLRANETFGARLSAGWGSNDSQQGSLTVYGLLSDEWDAMAYISRFDRDNFKDGDGNRTFGGEGEITNGLVKVGWEPASGHRFELSYDKYRDKGDYLPRPDMGVSFNRNRTGEMILPVTYDRDTATINYEYTPSQAIELKALAYYNQLSLTRDETEFATHPFLADRKGVNVAKDTNLGVKLSVSQRIGDHQLAYGAHYENQDNDTQFAKPGVQILESADKIALYVEDKIALTPRFSVTPAARYDSFDRRATSSSERYDDVSLALGAEFVANDYLTVFANSRELHKAPPLSESFTTTALSESADKDLKAEHGRTDETGVRLSNAAAQKDYLLTANLTVFRTELDDEIVVRSYKDGGGNWAYETTNRGDVTYRGFEASTYWAWQQWTASASYSRTDVSYSEAYQLDQIFGRARHLGDTVALNADYALTRWDVLLGWNTQIQRSTTVPDSNLTKPGYTVHNVFAQWQPMAVDGFTLTAGVDNLFDSRYRSHASTSGKRGAEILDYEPGRNIKLTASYQF